jgi:RNA polymerase sigma-B factor
VTRPTRHASAPEEDRLLRRYAESHDPELKAELSERFLPLARSLALRYRGTSEQLDDLFQVASLGLVKALDGFDPARGENFVAYAAPTILGELRRHFRDRVSDVRIPRGLQERAMAVSGAIRELSEEGGKTPTVSAIASRLELSEDEVSEALQADEARHTLSLDAPAGRADPDTASLGESVGEGEPGYERVEAKLAAAEAPLDERERTVLMLRFEADLTQYEIGRRVGVSQMQVSRIMRKALRKLLAAVQGGEGAEAPPPGGDRPE